ncbi:MAG: RNase adapter RapZ [Bacteroidales bacterium]|nr:RNase adapter RapZ [Bacteroidales bacterium]MDD4384196.1 RNase adapter RapZ [Bacteroidales bacterium]
MNHILQALFNAYFGSDAQSITPLPQGGSDRQYFRLKAKNISVIGAYNPDVEENRAFFYLTNHFQSKGFPVPEILSISSDQKAYILSDLSDETLFNRFIETDWSNQQGSDNMLIASVTLDMLAKIQVEGAKGLDFSKCYPKPDFDLQSVMWDFSYFKYSFLKPSGIHFNEAKLDDDFLAFANVLLSQPTGYFHYRDFQSRNVMLVDGQPYFIDYQGGRRGPLLYDVASFLYQARANFPQAIREKLFNSYLNSLNSLIKIDKDEQKLYFPIFALFRVIQTLGAYGYRGFFERRAHFIQSIPMAASNIQILINQVDSSLLQLPHLSGILNKISAKYSSSTEQTDVFDGLTVDVCSFSFKKGYPAEHPEHGGGFVFDCRALPNPGRLDEYKMLTGLDASVIKYLEEHGETDNFYGEMWGMVSDSIGVYSKRGFNHLSVSFGCTGGQHRSVYMASRFAKEVQQKFSNVKVLLKHREIKG